MKIVFLAPANSIHTVRWVNSLAERGHDITLLTLHGTELNHIKDGVKVIKLPFSAPLGYYANTWAAKKILRKIKPDLLHTHYASGYGTLSRFIGYSPTLLSVWGSDVFEFPYQSESNRKIITKNLQSATKIASTSYAMKVQTEKLIQPIQEISVTPFGIDLNKFKPDRNASDKSNGKLIIGMLKTMESKYGPQYLLQAIPLLLNKLEHMSSKRREEIQVLMVGRGNETEKLKSQASELGIGDIVTFVGEVPHQEVPIYLNKMDIYCAPSEQESFGVAVIEASACGVPVIVSNVGGLPEVVKDGETGYIVESKNPEQIADKLFELVVDRERRERFGVNGRKFVEEQYDWEKNVSLMEDVYRTLHI